MRSLVSAMAVVLCVAVGASAAHAQDKWPDPGDKPIKPPNESPPDPSKPMIGVPPPLKVVSAEDVAKSPPPDAASGVVKQHKTSAENALPMPFRALLFIPRWAFELVMLPLRGGLWAYERFQIGERTKNIFFNDDGTFGVFPVFFIETGFGMNGGLRLVHGDLFGGGEDLVFRISYGGRFRQIYGGSINTGERFGPITFDLNASFAIQPRDQFFGIGNGDQIDDYDPSMNPLIDPTLSDTSVQTRYREVGSRFLFGGDLQLGGNFFAHVSAGVLLREFEDLDEDDERELEDSLPLQQVYDTSALVGYDKNLTTGYGELELRYDTRTNRSRYVSKAVPASGWLLAGYAGYAQGFGDDDPTDYWRFGVDVQRNINLYDFSRILILRLYGETVVADDGKIPFTDFSRLGGRTLLRGYAIDRFRDKTAALASAEYQWELTTNLSAFLFADAGRVWNKLADVELDSFRLGLGGGLQLHSAETFLARIDFASSIDGGFFVNLSLDPVYDTRARMERD